VSLSSLFPLALCDHLCCSSCCRAAARAAEASFTAAMGVGCPAPGCGALCTDTELRALLGPGDHARLAASALEEVIGCSGAYARCPAPTCGFTVERVPAGCEPGGLMDRAPAEVSGVPLVGAARRHYAEYRFKCRECRTEFCASCSAVPYHVGHTCESYREFLIAKRCTYCDSVIPKDALIAATPAAELVLR
jgi:hypothetical protein